MTTSRGVAAISLIAIALAAPILVQAAAEHREGAASTATGTLEDVLPVHLGDDWKESIGRLESDGTKCSIGEGGLFTQMAACRLKGVPIAGQDFRTVLLTTFGGDTVNAFAYTIEPFTEERGGPSAMSCAQVRKAVVKALGPKWRTLKSTKSETKLEQKGERSASVYCRPGAILSLAIQDAWPYLPTGQFDLTNENTELAITGLLFDRIITFAIIAQHSDRGPQTDVAVKTITKDFEKGAARATAKSKTLSPRNQRALAEYVQTALSARRIEEAYLRQYNKRR